MSNFFRFPIALLAFNPQDPRETQQTILHWCVYGVGNSTYGHLTDADLIKEAKDADIDAFRDLNPHGRGECLPFLGARCLGVTFRGSVRGVEETYSRAERFLCSASEASRNNRVNVSDGFFWDCLYTLRGESKERSLQWRDYRILCALTSKIGKFQYQKCGWREIQARAAGWCGKADMAIANPKELKRREPLILTRDKIRATLDRMEADKCFARFVYGGERGGESWFSFSCDGDQNKLVDWIKKRKCRHAEHLHKQREADAHNSVEIRSIRNGSTNPQKHKPRTDPQPAPNINQNIKKIPNINKKPEFSKIIPNRSPTCPPSNPQSTPNIN